MENEYYDRIVYKKNAYSELKEDLEKYYYGKKIMLFTTKSLTGAYLTEIMNSISMAKCEFKYYVAKNNYSNLEIKEITEILIKESFDLYIVFGANRACSVVKYFSSIFNLPYMVCPSACSSVGYFSNVCINPCDSTKSFLCDNPERIYISEGVIKTCPRNLVKQGVFFIMSMCEIVASNIIENILFDKHLDLSDISKIINKLKNELFDIMSGDNDVKLKLMDMLIELGYSLTKIDLLKNSMFNLYCILQKVFEKNKTIVGSGELFLLASKTLLLCYINYFEQKKIKQLEYPDFQKVVKNIKKYSIFHKKINNFAFFKQILNKKELIVRVNNLKEEFSFQCKKRISEQEELLKNIKRYDEVFLVDSPQINDVFSAVNVLPYVCENNYIVYLLGGMGFVNAF